MTRATDLQKFDEMRQINTELVDLCHAMINLIVELGSAVSAAGGGKECSVMIGAAVEDMGISLRDINERCKTVFDAQAENVRLTLHGAP